MKINYIMIKNGLPRTHLLGGEFDGKSKSYLGESARVLGGELVQSVGRRVDVRVDLRENSFEGESGRIAGLGPARVVAADGELASTPMTSQAPKTSVPATVTAAGVDDGQIAVFLCKLTHKLGKSGVDIVGDNSIHGLVLVHVSHHICMNHPSSSDCVFQMTNNRQ